MFIQRLFIFSALALSCSCLKQSESITPITAPQTLAELQKESLINTANLAGNSELSNEAIATLEMATDPKIFYLNLKYNINDIDVFTVANMPNSFEQIGHSFLLAVTKAVLALAGPRQISLNNITFTIPESINLDRSIVKSISVKRIFLQYNSVIDTQSDYAADFSFIDTLELSRQTTLPGLVKIDTLFLSYRKARNFCLYKCIQFDILEDNIIDLLKPRSQIVLKPNLSISSMPHVNDLRLDGEIDLKIGLALPF